MDLTSPIVLLSGAVTALTGAVVFMFQTGKKEREKLDELFRLERENLLSSFVKERTEMREVQETQFSQLLAISKETNSKLGEMTSLLSSLLDRRTAKRNNQKLTAISS